MYGEEDTAWPIRIRISYGPSVYEYICFGFFIVFDILLCGWALDEAELGIVSVLFFFRWKTRVEVRVER